jgi:hypothetical protein
MELKKGMKDRVGQIVIKQANGGKGFKDCKSFCSHFFLHKKKILDESLYDF